MKKYLTAILVLVFSNSYAINGDFHYKIHNLSDGYAIYFQTQCHVGASEYSEKMVSASQTLQDVWSTPSTTCIQGIFKTTTHPDTPSIMVLTKDGHYIPTDASRCDNTVFMANDTIDVQVSVDRKETKAIAICYIANP